MSALFKGMAWIASTGEYSAGSDVMVFDETLLTSDQWQTIDNMAENDRLTYINAVVTGNVELVEYMERVANAY